VKRKDLNLIITAAIISAVIALVFSRLFISSNTGNQKAEVVDPITAEFKTPDTKYFNSNSINPTQLIQIGDNNNSQPFR
jgi:hypothetical protein